MRFGRVLYKPRERCYPGQCGQLRLNLTEVFFSCPSPYPATVCYTVTQAVHFCNCHIGFAFCATRTARAMPTATHDCAIRSCTCSRAVTRRSTSVTPRCVNRAPTDPCCTPTTPPNCVISASSPRLGPATGNTARVRHAPCRHVATASCCDINASHCCLDYCD